MKNLRSRQILEPGFWVSSFSNYEARIFTMSWPANQDEHMDSRASDKFKPFKHCLQTIVAQIFNILSVFLSVCLSVYLSVCLYLCLSVSRSVYLSVCLSVCIFLCLYVCQLVCMFVLLSLKMPLHCFIACRICSPTRPSGPGWS